MFDPRNLAPEVFARGARALDVPEESIRGLIAAVVGRGILDPSIWARDYQIPRRLRDAVPTPMPRLVLRAVGHLAASTASKSCSSARMTVCRVESVLIPLHKPGAVSVCLSSQVGCAMGCVFCATARMPVSPEPRNLGDHRPVPPGARARPFPGPPRDRRGLHGNGRAVSQLRPRPGRGRLAPLPVSAASVGARSITISTVGLVPEIDRYTREGRPFRLAISLGAATDAKRARLVPVAARTPVAEVMAAARRHALARRERVMLVYVCIGGVNVDESDAQALADLIGDTPVRLDLIEVTDHTGRFLRPDARGIQAVPRRARPQARAACRAPLFRRRRHQCRLRHAGRNGLKATLGHGRDVRIAVSASA